MNRTITLACALSLAAFLVPAVANAKKAPEITGLELQQIQSRDIESEKSTAFGAMMSVLQDAGYRIQAADLETGLITGIGSSKAKMTWTPFVGFGKAEKSPMVSAYIEGITPSMTRIRLNFVMAKVKSTMYGSQPQDEEPVTDAAVYKDAFEKVEQAVFLRQSMATTLPAAPTQTPAPVASAPAPAAPAAQ